MASRPATSEQAFRASIRQAMLNMNLRPESATKAEIRVLKAQGILGKRAPSCSLLSAGDMCRLLIAFGKEQCAEELREATLSYGREHVMGVGSLVPPMMGVSMGVGVEGVAAYEGAKAVTATVTLPRYTVKDGRPLGPDGFTPFSDPIHLASHIPPPRKGDSGEAKAKKERKKGDKAAKAGKDAKGGEKEGKAKERKRKRKAESSPRLSSTPASALVGLDALLSAVNDASTPAAASPQGSSIPRAVSTPPSFAPPSSLHFAAPSAVHPPASGTASGVFPVAPAPSNGFASQILAPVPLRSPTPGGFSFSSQSPSPSAVSPSSTSTSTSAFSSPTSAPRPLTAKDRERSGSTSPASEGGDPALVRVDSARSEREERELTLEKLAALNSAEGAAARPGGAEAKVRRLNDGGCEAMKMEG